MRRPRLSIVQLMAIVLLLGIGLAVLKTNRRPEDPGRPIDARVLPVKITFGEPTPLKLGQRVEIELLPGEGRESPG